MFLLQIVNKGLVSYRDPDSAPGRGQKTLHVTGDMNLTKMFSKAVRELSDPQGSTVIDVDNHIRGIYSVDVPPGLDFQVSLLKLDIHTNYTFKQVCIGLPNFQSNYYLPDYN